MGGDTTVQAPTPVDPAQVGADTLETQLRLAPQVFAANQQYLPQYAQLATDVAGSTLPALLNLQSQANTAQRGSDIADVQNLAPAALQAWRAANPNLTGAQDQLSGAITSAGNQAPPRVGAYTAAAPNLSPAALQSSPRLGQAAQQRVAGLGPAAMQATPTLASAALQRDPRLGAFTRQQTANLGNAAQLNGAQAAGSPLQGQLESDAGAALGQVTPIQLELQRQAMQQLGADLSPAQLAKVQQDTRAAYAARGLYDSNQAIGAEVLNTDAARSARLAAAQQFAQGVDQSGQQQVANNRAYAGNVAQLGTQASQFNAGQQQQAGLSNQAAVNQFLQTQYSGNNATNAANAAAANQFALQRYNTAATIGTNNQAAQNQFALTQFGASANSAAANAAAANQYGLARFGAANDASAANQAAQNQFALTRYGTDAGVNAANAAAQNQFSLAQYGTQTGLNQFNAGQFTNADQINAQLGLGSQQQNISNLFNLANQYAGTSQDPYQLVLGRSAAPAAATNLAQNAGPTMFNPFDPSITQIYAGNQANNLAAQTASANGSASSNAGMMAGLGSAALAAAIFFCWVAQAAYGAEDPRWLMFRRYMLRRSPLWFFKLYLRDGQHAARRVAANPVLAARVRELMENILNKEASNAW